MPALPRALSSEALGYGQAVRVGQRERRTLLYIVPIRARALHTQTPPPSITPVAESQPVDNPGSMINVINRMLKDQITINKYSYELNINSY